MKRIFLAGEGRHELGGWFQEKTYRDDPPATGVVQALLERVADQGWEITHSLRWKDIRKLRAGGHRGAEKHNVKALFLMAREASCDVVVFVRDRDKNKGRQLSIEAAVGELVGQEGQPDAIGGVVIERIEDWISVLLKKKERAKVDPKELDTVAMVGVIETADLHGIPRRSSAAKSLHYWLAQAKTVLGPEGASGS